LQVLAEKGFYSLRPEFNENDENLIWAYKEKGNTLAMARQSAIDDEQLIADDNFAFFLNDQKEIQVGDSIYKYTNNGLYFVHVNDLDYLYEYLDKQGEPSGRFNPCEEPMLTVIDEVIIKFVPDNNCMPNPGGGGNPGGGAPQPGLPQFINNLKECTPRGGSFSFVFGTSKICEDFFSNDKKIKTKYWNQSYYLFASIGISVKSRKKTLGVWLNSKADEIGYGVSEAHFRFNLPTQNFSYLEPSYIFKGTRYDKNGQQKGSAVPAWPFKSPLEIYVPLPVKPLNAVYTEDELNKLFWGAVWDQTKSILKNFDQDKPTDVTFIGITPTHIYASYVNLDKKKRNASVIRKVFDWNIEITLNLLGNNNSFSPQITKIGQLYDYSKAKVDFYGYGKRGYSYKGSRLVFGE